MKNIEYLTNKRDPQRPVYRVDFTARTYKLVAGGHSGGCRTPDISGKFRDGGFTGPWFAEVDAL